MLSWSMSFTSVVAQGEEVETEDISGVVRIVRSSPETEIFFIDRKDSVIVPQGAVDANKIIKMSLDSVKTKKSVSMTIDPVSRRFVSLPGSKKAKGIESDSAETTTEIVPAKKTNVPVFKEIPSDNAK